MISNMYLIDKAEHMCALSMLGYIVNVEDSEVSFGLLGGGIQTFSLDYVESAMQS